MIKHTKSDKDKECLALAHIDMLDFLGFGSYGNA